MALVSPPAHAVLLMVPVEMYSITVATSVAEGQARRFGCLTAPRQRVTVDGTGLFRAQCRWRSADGVLGLADAKRHEGAVVSSVGVANVDGQKKTAFNIAHHCFVSDTIGIEVCPNLRRRIPPHLAQGR